MVWANMILPSTVTVNEVVRDVARNSPLLVEELEVVTERQVRDVLVPPPHVRRPEELPGRQLVGVEVAMS